MIWERAMHKHTTRKIQRWDIANFTSCILDLEYLHHNTAFSTILRIPINYHYYLNVRWIEVTW